MIRLPLASALVVLAGLTAVTPASANDVRFDQYGWSNSAGGSQQGYRNRIRVHQDGRYNRSLSEQRGSNNLSVIGQEGRRHSGATYQYGSRNSAGIGQFGSDHTTILSQDGHGNIAAGVQCQTAFKIDPLSASKIDPLRRWLLARSERIGAGGEEEIGPGAFCAGRAQRRCLKRQLSLPVSTMSQWWVRRSSSAVVILASPKTDGHSPNAKFVVTITEVCS